MPYLQANFMFGLDTDAGDEPIELTKEFMTRTPFVWPVVNIPHPFGGTPLYERYLEEGRILTSMPFAFYYSTYLVTRLKNYHPDGFYRRLIDLFTHFTSAPMLARRVASARHGHVRTLHVVRTFVKRRRVLAFRRILHQLETDRSFRAFHEGETPRLPEFYHRELERLLGHYAELIPREERTPLLATESAPARRVASSSRPSTGLVPSRRDAAPEEVEVSRRAIEVGGDRRRGDTKAHSRSFSASGELRKHLAAEATEEGSKPSRTRRLVSFESSTAWTRRRFMPVIQDRWDSEEEATVLATFSQQGVAPEAVKEMYSWWVSLFNGALGDARNLDLAATESEFRAIAKRPSTTSSGS